MLAYTLLMREMLGNHYFLIRDYAAAINEYCSAYNENLPNPVIKKLIICFLTQDDFSSAETYFLKLLKEDPSLIIDTDTGKEDCPCNDLINEYEKKENYSYSHFTRLGMLCLYCDIEVSKSYFEKALHINSNSKFVQNTLDILNNIKDKRVHL